MKHAIKMLTDKVAEEKATIRKYRKNAYDWQRSVNEARNQLISAEKELSVVKENQRKNAEVANDAQIRLNDIEAAIAKLEAV